MAPVRPSWWWIAGAVAAALVATAAVVAAVQIQRAADRPVGEGELFLEEAQAAATFVTDLIDRGIGTDDAVRRLRNRLTIEAVALVGPDGEIVSSTSPSLVGTELSNGFLRFGLEAGRFTAVAAPIPDDIRIDGVVEWSAGDVLYQVLYPLGDGGLFLHYDMSQLLQRRARQQGIQAETLQLLAVGAFLALLSGLLWFGRSRAVLRYREVAIEADYLRRHSEELSAHNRELDKARNEAERALALAEEKSRIRAEFVLMINHELRTPLTSVVTGAELLQTEGLLSPAERQQLLEDMVHDGQRLQDMIAQMLMVARIENRGLSYTLRQVPPEEVGKLLAAAHPKVVMGRTELHTPDLRTDPQTLAQLVASLADNAFTHGARKVVVSYLRELDLEPMYEVGVRPEPAGYVVVADDGPGIDSDFVPRAFEKFEKDSDSSGTGLGLYVAKMMVEAIEGSLGVATSPDGTSMIVAVPLTEARVPSEVAT